MTKERANGLSIPTTCPAKRLVTAETIFMKLRKSGHSVFRIAAGSAKILIDPFLTNNPPRDNGWIGCHAGEHSTQGGGR